MDAARLPLWRRWAPFGLLLVTPVVGVLTGLLVSGPRGHWSGHVGSGAAAAGQLLAVVTGAVLARRQLNVLLVVLLAVVAVGLVLEVVGNQRVAASIWQTSYGDEEAAAIGPSFDGFESCRGRKGAGQRLEAGWIRRAACSDGNPSGFVRPGKRAQCMALLGVERPAPGGASGDECVGPAAFLADLRPAPRATVPMV